MANRIDLQYFLDYVTHTPFTRNDAIHYLTKLMIEI